MITQTKHGIIRPHYYCLFRDYYQQTYGRKAKKKVDDFDHEKVYNKKYRYLPANLWFYGLFWGPALFFLLTLIFFVLSLSFDSHYFYEQLFLSVAKSRADYNQIIEIFKGAVIDAEGNLSQTSTIEQLLRHTTLIPNTKIWDLFSDFVQHGKFGFSKIFQLMVGAPQIFFSINFVFLLPLLIAILIPPVSALIFAWIWFNYGYWKFYKWRRLPEWSWQRENEVERDKQRKARFLLSYDEYLEIKDMKAVLLDDDLYAKTGGHNGLGFAFKTFITSNQNQIDHIVETGKLPEDLWKETYSFETGEIQSKGYQETMEMIKKTKYNSQAFALGDKKANADKPEVAEFFKTHKYGVVVINKTSAYCEGISGSGKGQSQVLPELFANLTSREKVSVLLTFKANLEEFKLLEYMTKKRKLDFWKLRLDAPAQSMSYNPLSFCFFFNELFRQLKYGKPTEVTDFSPADFENSFTLSWKWKTPKNLQEKYSIESKKSFFSRDKETVNEYLEYRQIFKQTHLFSKKAVLNFIAQTEGNDNIFKFEKLKDYENMTDSLFLNAIKFYESDKFKVLNCYHPVLFFAYKQYDYWTDEVKSKTKNWIQLGNWAFVDQAEYEKSKNERASWAKMTSIDLLDKFVETLVKISGSSTTGDQKVWTDWAKACVLFFLLAYLDLTEYSPLFSEEYFNLPSYGLWFTQMCENAPDDRTPAFREVFIEYAKTAGLISTEAIEKANSTYGTQEGQWNGIKGTASTLLGKFGPTSPIKTIILRNDISPLKLPVNPTLCLVVPDQNVDASGNALMPALCDIISTATQIIMSERSIEQACPINTLFLLDEAGSGFPPPANLIINTLALGRSAKKFIVLYYQSMSQVSRARYGEQAEELLKTIQTAKLRKLVATDNSNAKFWEEQFGQMNYSQWTHTARDKGVKEFEQRLADDNVTGAQQQTGPLFNTTELASLRTEVAISRYESFKPYLAVTPFFGRSDVFWKWLRTINETMTEEEINNTPAQILADKWEEDYYLDFFEAFDYVKNEETSSTSWLISDSSLSKEDLAKYFEPLMDEVIDILCPPDNFPNFTFGDEEDDKNTPEAEKITEEDVKEYVDFMNKSPDELLQMVDEATEERRKILISSSFDLFDEIKDDSSNNNSDSSNDAIDSLLNSSEQKPLVEPQEIVDTTLPKQIRKKVKISASFDTKKLFNSNTSDKELNKKLGRNSKKIIIEADDDDW